MSAYKWCIVPMCTNTTISEPEKYFVHVPKDENRRKKWLQMMKRKTISAKSTCYVCEDHFDMQNDIENYMEVKMMGVKLRPKPNAVPHIFNCQKKRLLPERLMSVNRKRKSLVNDLLQNQQSTSALASSTDMDQIIVSAPVILEEVAADMDVDENQQSTSVLVPTIPNEDILEPINEHLFQNKGVQARCHFRSKSTQVSFKEPPIQVKNVLLSPIKLEMRNKATMCCLIGDSKLNTESEVELTEGDSTDYCDTEVSEYETDDEDEFKRNMQMMSLKAIEKNPRIFTGIIPEVYSVVTLLSKFTKVPTRDILITLKKIRCGDTYARLAIDFGMAPSNVCRIFQSSIKFLSLLLRKVIFWPKDQEILRKIPIPFRARYAKTRAIIDCFEIQIEKPTNPLHQALTWSNYKNCNTLKYLISSTPDGFVTFISCGYGGRATDSTIVEDSGYLEKLTPGSLVMADRGFKAISFALEEKKCKLVRPPTVFKNILSTSNEVKTSKQIAALRIHIERVINRIREFNMLLPHACVDKQLIPIFDDVLNVACGLINLQPLLIKR